MVILQKVSFETARVDIMGIDPFYHPPSIAFRTFLDRARKSYEFLKLARLNADLDPIEIVSIMLSVCP